MLPKCALRLLAQVRTGNVASNQHGYQELKHIVCGFGVVELLLGNLSVTLILSLGKCLGNVNYHRFAITVAVDVVCI